MDQVAKLKQWINEQAPMLSNIYENKYVGMLYDRFASLPPKQQKQIVIGAAATITGIVVIYLMMSYWSLWSITQNTEQASNMANVLLQYQKQKRDKSPQTRFLERNNQLAGPGQLKQQLTEMARMASISPKLVQVEERSEAAPTTDEAKGASEVKMKRASVTLQKVNLTQLVSYLRNVEFGQYNLSVPSIKINNDDKMRGYMNVELSVVAYIFTSEEA